MKKLAALVGVTALAAVAPLPPTLVERVYSKGIFPRLQGYITPLTNLSPVAVLDVVAALILVVGVGAFLRRWRAGGARVAFGRLAVWIVAGAAIVYLSFLVLWGFNYRRPALESSLDFDRGRIGRAEAVRLATHAIEQLNSGHAAAHAAEFNTHALADAFFDAQAALGGGSVEVGRPKRSVLQWYFRQAALNGMTVPHFLEIILNPDLLVIEVPGTLAHEWAHLAGYADEAEANFVAWLACVRSEDPLIRYSGWLEAYSLALGGLPRDARARLPALAEGPRQDLRAIAARLRRSSPVVSTAARQAYDSYLKANRVEEGIDSYGAALQLILGTRFEEGWKPARR